MDRNDFFGIVRGLILKAYWSKENRVDGEELLRELDKIKKELENKDENRV